MKNKKIKNNKNFRSGFVILFAVTLSAILLSIALGVANISYKEVSFSTSARDSNDAFLAADTGAECALFYDKLENGSFPVEGPGPATITCASATSNNINVESTFGPNSAQYNFVVTGLGSNGTSCAKVEISKDNSVIPIKALITSTGYNIGDENCDSTNIHRVERELLVSSYVGAKPAYVPPSASFVFKCNSAVVESCSYDDLGSNTLLSWTTTEITENCTASGGSGSPGWVATEPSKSWGSANFTTGTLTSTQTYTLTCGGISKSITVNVASAPSIAASPSAVAGGANIAVAVTNGPANSTDWVGMYNSSETSNNVWLDWFYLNGAKTAPASGVSSANLNFTAPSTSGTVKFRLLSNNTFTDVATSNNVTVTAAPTPTCQDPSASNYGGPLPCDYPPPPDSCEAHGWHSTANGLPGNCPSGTCGQECRVYQGDINGVDCWEVLAQPQWCN